MKIEFSSKLPKFEPEDEIEYDDFPKIPVTEEEDFSTKYDPNEIVATPEENYKPSINEFLQIGFLSKEEDFPIDEIGDFFKVYRVLIKGWFKKPIKRILLIPKDWYQIKKENNVSELYTVEYLQKMLKEFEVRYLGFPNISEHFEVYLGWFKVVEVINE
jgi:hypothetical protein